ncbi:MAG: excalibur calcium-binding domain-containing protein [Chloroflexi bacterium]|nr:excalibur calcium-binding domain-containing protein [Chloroflexota bacterium]
MTLARRVLLVALLLSAAACGDLLDSVAPSPATPIPVDLSLTIAEPPDDLPPYDRDEWPHWVDDDGDCQDTRQEVLVAESRDRVTYRDDRRCSVEAGRWLDPYTGATYTDPRDLDIDHLVPLANAHRSGGWAWSAERKRQFANSLGDDAHLIAVTALVNREKGAKGPEEWRPPDEAYWCEYASSWAGVKQTWGLTATHAETIALQDMLKTCDGVVEFEAAGEALVAQPAAPQPIRAYASCDEAAAAGEPRVKGGVGEGWGFPASLLPNNRDGDGDGVVCEVVLAASAQPTAMPLPTATSTFVPSATPAPVRVYTTCDQAAAAGEERVQGYIGPGVGFSAASVPSARDGDGDGIVCEVDAPATATPQSAPAPADATATPTPAASTPAPTATSTAATSPSPTAAATPAPSTARTYASCDEAEAAGEERVQGSIGEGWGFPAEIVPGARDGDGDGVVCEARRPASSSGSPDPTPTVAPGSDGTYASCDDAEAAGEPRLQGSSGPGRGFPAELVPGARDGDGDGVVCEE